MDKLEAAHQLIQEGEFQTANPAQFKRTVKALKVLGFTQEEIVSVLQAQEYLDEAGYAYNARIAKVWKP